MWSKTISCIWLMACLSLLFTGQVFAVNGAGSEEFREGVSAFKAGNYNQALTHFEASRRQGNRDPRLLYNLAVTYYKLRQFGEAEGLFRMLIDEPEWADLSRYNLGLIARQRGDRRAAERWFRKVQDTAASDKLIYLAGEGLRELGVAVRPARVVPPRKWFTLLSLTGGYDDNAIAFPDRLQTRSSQGEDSFAEFLGYGQVYLSGNRGDGVRLHGFVYTKQYIDLDVVDIVTFNAGLIHDMRYRGWDIEYGAGAGYTEIDGDELTTQVQGTAGVRRNAGSSEYRINYQPVYHDGGSNFRHLDGWEHRVDLRWRHRVEGGRLTARYRLEIHDRDDLAVDNTFLSYSPVRHGGLLEWDWYITPSWTFTAGGEFTNSRFSDRNRLTDIDGVFKEKKRKADLIEAWAKVQYQLNPQWRILAEYSYQDNDDNFQLFTYDRNEIKLAVEFTY